MGEKGLVVQRSEDDGCHSEPEQRGGEESRRTEDCTRDSSACGLRMTDPQNQCDETLEANPIFVLVNVHHAGVVTMNRQKSLATFTFTGVLLAFTCMVSPALYAKARITLDTTPTSFFSGFNDGTLAS